MTMGEPRRVLEDDDLPDDHLSVARLWCQQEAAMFLGVTTRYLRDSSCPKMLLPGNGPKGQPLVRYDPTEVRAWVRSWHTGTQSTWRNR